MNSEKIVHKELAEHYPHLKRIVSYMARNEGIVDDIVQECCVRILEKENLWSGDVTTLRQWMNTITRRVVVDRLRKKRKTRLKCQQLEEQVLQEKQLSQAYSESDVRWLISQFSVLSNKQQRILKMRYYRGMTMAAIAKELGSAKSTVSHHIDQALKVLRRRAHVEGVSGLSLTPLILRWPWKWVGEIFVASKVIKIVLVLLLVFALGYVVTSYDPEINKHDTDIVVEHKKYSFSDKNRYEDLVKPVHLLSASYVLKKKEFNYDDLMIEFLDVDKDKNAYTYFLMAAEKFREDQEYSESLKKMRSFFYSTDFKNITSLTDFFAENNFDMNEFFSLHKEVFSLLDKGLVYEDSQLSTVIGWDDDVSEVFDFVSMSKILSVYGRFLCEGDKSEEAIGINKMNFNFLNLLEQTKGHSVLQSVAAIASKKLAYSEMNKSMAMGYYDMDELNLFLSLSNNTKSKSEVIINSFKVDFMAFDKMMSDPKQMLKFFYEDDNRYTKEQINNVSAEKIIEEYSYQLREMISSVENNENFKMHLEFCDENSLEGDLIDSLVSSSNLLINRTKQSQSDTESLKLQVALYSYQKNNGELPETLYDLQPNFLENEVIDPTTGRGFEYDKSNRIFHSYGTNQFEGDHVYEIIKPK